MAEEAILGYLESKDEISDSGHQKRDVDAYDEGRAYTATGSPEVQLFLAIPSEGIPKEELQKKLDPSVFKIGSAQAAKRKWVEMGKQLVIRKESCSTQRDEEIDALGAGQLAVVWPEIGSKAVGLAGLVCDRGLALGDLLGVLKEFFPRLGMSKLRFKPAYNPYTEPSMEIFSYHEGLGKWVEIGNSGMFRPEMLLPMGLPEDVRVIAWGLSLESRAWLYGMARLGPRSGTTWLGAMVLEESRLRRLAWATCLEEGSLARAVGLLEKWVYGPAGGREEEWAVETGRWVTDYCGPGPSGGALGCSLVGSVSKVGYFKDDDVKIGPEEHAILSGVRN
ncbi:phenylalanine--tRNA ligase alpha subunit [Pyrus ussuriensis x Pyrus communis]|uniref:Phenylalanine--tRNA ligase alpha subunit n=1 Tax=Pyrus ussuriensis x Pyrus communis TaxID=2448454 RepID=A0A5N5I658_9ROSA|nr:phenylalanine--tRNA ligase alpha subunit [Pyrus ussuriensis x Pyrus communis]